MLLQQMLVLLVNSCKSVPLITWRKKLNPDIFSSKLENKEDKCGSGFFCMLLEDDLMEEEKKSLNIFFAEQVTDFLSWLTWYSNHCKEKSEKNLPSCDDQLTFSPDLNKSKVLTASVKDSIRRTNDNKFQNDEPFQLL